MGQQQNGSNVIFGFKLLTERDQAAPEGKIAWGIDDPQQADLENWHRHQSFENEKKAKVKGKALYILWMPIQSGKTVAA